MMGPGFAAELVDSMVVCLVILGVAIVAGACSIGIAIGYFIWAR